MTIAVWPASRADAHAVLATTILIASLGVLGLIRRWSAVRRLTTMGGDRIAAIAPRLFALTTFLAGAILIVSGATPARAGRLGWVNNVLPLPIVEASAYFASIAGVGLIILARGIQRRLDAAYHLTVWLLIGGIVFALASALDIEQAVGLSIMLIVLVPSRRFFYRKSSILEERFTRGWILAIVAVLVGAIATAVLRYGSQGLGAHVLFTFSDTAQGARAERALAIAATALAAFGATRLIRPARIPARTPSAEELDAAECIVAKSPRASAQLAFLGDKSLMFNSDRTAFIMYGIAGSSWVALGDPVGSTHGAVELIDKFVTAADQSGGWPVFYRAPPTLVHLYLEYSLAVVKLGEVARVSLSGFSLDGPARRNLRRVWRKIVDEGCTFAMIPPDEVPAIMPQLRRISDEWLRVKGSGEKGFSLGRFDAAFIRRSAVGVVRQRGEIIAFITMWRSGQKAEIEVDLMRYLDSAPRAIMRYALTEAMLWAHDQGFESFNLGAAPLSGIRATPATPVWNQLSIALRGAGERYYNFQGVREFKEWFHPEWESIYLVSPGGTKRPIVLANIAALVSGGYRAVFRR